MLRRLRVAHRSDVARLDVFIATVRLGGSIRAIGASTIIHSESGICSTGVLVSPAILEIANGIWLPIAPLLRNAISG